MTTSGVQRVICPAGRSGQPGIEPGWRFVSERAGDRAQIIPMSVCSGAGMHAKSRCEAGGSRNPGRPNRFVLRTCTANNTAFHFR